MVRAVRPTYSVLKIYPEITNDMRTEGTSSSGRATLTPLHDRNEAASSQSNEAARVNSPRATLTSSTNSTRLLVQRMAATTLTAIPPQVPSLSSVKERVEAGLAKETEYNEKQAKNLITDVDLESKTFTVRQKDIARLQLCDRGLKAVSALMPAGQGNQRHIVNLSGQRAFVATQKMRNLIGAMKADYDPLWSICELKTKISKSTLPPQLHERIPELVELEKNKISVKNSYGKKDPERDAQLTRIDRAIESKTNEILGQTEGIKPSKLEKLAKKLAKFAKSLAKAEVEWAQMQAGLDSNTKEENLTKRFLSLATFGAGNCGDYAEAGFYLITHGFVGDIPPDTPIYQVELDMDL